MATAHSALTDLSQLVPLLYRADWTQLCLSAEISTRVRRYPWEATGPGRDAWRLAADGEPDEEDPPETGRPPGAAHDAARPGQAGAEDLPRWREGVSRVLIAPGGRCRVEDAGPHSDRSATICDGETWWRVSPDDAAGLHEVSMQADFASLLDPSSLVGRFDLELTGSGEAAGRPGYRVAATLRLLAAQAASPGEWSVDRVDAVVDADLGILLRRDAFADGRRVEFSEIRSLTLNPAEAADPARFTPPEGLPTTQVWPVSWPFPHPSGTGWQVVTAGAKAVGAAAMFAARHLGHGPPPDVADPPMPEPGRPPSAARSAPPGDDGPGTGSPGTGSPGTGSPGTGSPGTGSPGDDLVNLLHRTGLPPLRFAADVRKWADPRLAVRGIAERQASLGLSAVLGPEELWQAIANRLPGISFQTARMRVAMPGRYRIDYLAGGWREQASACDGERQWTLYPNRVVSMPARPLAGDWARLCDPAWLLLSRWRLSAGGAADVGGRPGWRIWADAVDVRPGGGRPGWRIWADAADVRPGGGHGPDAALFSRAVATVDAQLGILLQLIYLAEDRPAVCYELHDVSVPDASPDDFRVSVPPGTRVVHGSGLLDQLDAPAPLRAAWSAGKAGVAGASALAGWLQRLRR